MRTVVLVALPAVLRAGEQEIGDVAFAGGAPLLSGVVVDPSGAPVAGVEVHAMQTTSYGVRSPVEDVGAATTGADGRFRLEGDPAIGRFEAGIEADGWYRRDPAEFEPGATDVRLAEGRMLPAPPFTPTASIAWTDPADRPGGTRGGDPRDSSAFAPDFGASRVVSFEVDDPGTYRVVHGLRIALDGGGAT